MSWTQMHTGGQKQFGFSAGDKTALQRSAGNLLQTHRSLQGPQTRSHQPLVSTGTNWNSSTYREEDTTVCIFVVYEHM
ncbi:hypothetical protein AMECASPLE_024427 [Ameca splendens]|uniref:Uncharacterized protein n=1 Tax=Ameca splendens TaxID=208324 RepID=A0ABV0YFF8_9TELE